MKSLLCLIGLHDWHEHESYASGYYVRGSNPALYWRDRVCLREHCKQEDRKASRLWAKDIARREKKIAAEALLRTKPDTD